MKKRIGDVAKAAGVSVETVRFYQRAGVLDAPEKPARGWLTYDRNVDCSCNMFVAPATWA